MTNVIRCTLGYALRSGETLESVAKRFGATSGGRALSGGIVELPIAIDLAAPVSAKASTLSQGDLSKRFPGAKVSSTDSHGVRTYMVETDLETFDVTVRADRLYVTTFDGYGGVDEVNDTVTAALGRAYEAYRAVIAARKL